MAIFFARAHPFNQIVSVFTRQRKPFPVQSYFCTVSNSDSQIQLQNTAECTLENFKDIAKSMRKLNTPKKLIKFVDELSAENKLSQSMAFHAYLTLQRMNRTETSFQAVSYWLLAAERESFDLSTGSALLKSLCRLHRLDLAESVAAKARLQLGNYKYDYTFSSEKGDSDTDGVGHSELRVAMTLLPDLALGYATIGQFPKMLSLLECLRKNNGTVDLEHSKNLLKQVIRGTGASSSTSIDTSMIRRTLKCLLLLGGLTDNDSIQLLTNCYMHSMEFRFGVVQMSGMPPEDCPEAAFMGRSNVGKSSLINMVSNRKGLAFTSKTPGKTSEFNFFEARSKDGSHRFHLVDMPGVGYAEVVKSQRQGWLELLRSYAVNRQSLRVLFHLVDSRRGLMEADEQCLSLLADLPDHVQYVIVLTKADKRGGGVRRDFLARIKADLERRSARPIPVICTSSEKKEGGALLWSVLLDCLAGGAPDSFESLLEAKGGDIDHVVTKLEPDNVNAVGHGT